MHRSLITDDGQHQVVQLLVQLQRGVLLPVPGLRVAAPAAAAGRVREVVRAAAGGLQQHRGGRGGGQRLEHCSCCCCCCCCVLLVRPLQLQGDVVHGRAVLQRGRGPGLALRAVQLRGLVAEAGGVAAEQRGAVVDGVDGGLVLLLPRDLLLQTQRLQLVALGLLLHLHVLCCDMFRFLYVFVAVFFLPFIFSVLLRQRGRFC